MLKSIKIITSKFIAHIINLIIKTFKLGGGYTWPGHIILKLFPSILKDLISNVKYGIILVTGTNGKTTTASVLSFILRDLGYTVAHNSTGANLLNGVVSELLLTPLPVDYCVFEVDEFHFPEVFSQTEPLAVVFLNLSRDQLDRYGEVDTVFERWLSSLTAVDSTFPIVVDSRTLEFEVLPGIFGDRVKFFSESPSLLEASSLQGSFNAKNLSAVSTTLGELGVSEAQVKEHLKNFVPAYGRGEVIMHKDLTFRLFLAKNPASFNRNLDLTFDEPHSALLFVLNDRIPDGRDISWIYDIDPVKLSTFCLDCPVYVSGTRAEEMALRLKYAGVEVTFINPNLRQTVDQLHLDSCTSVLCLPNYSSMLELRKLLTGRKIK